MILMVLCLSFIALLLADVYISLLGILYILLLLITFPGYLKSFLMLMANSRIRTTNISVFTSLRRKLHDAEREAYELVNVPFLSDEEMTIADNIYSQILFCLELSRDK